MLKNCKYVSKGCIIFQEKSNRILEATQPSIAKLMNKYLQYVHMHIRVNYFIGTQTLWKIFMQCIDSDKKEH